MSNLTNLVTEQFNDLNNSYNNQKKQTQEKFLHKQQESEGEHKETIAQLNIELKSNEVQLLNLIRKIEDKRGSMVTVEELASVLTLISEPINTDDTINTTDSVNATDSANTTDSTNATLENDISAKSSKNSISKTKKATISDSKEKPKTISNTNTSSEDTSNSIPKPAPKYKGRYYR